MSNRDITTGIGRINVIEVLNALLPMHTLNSMEEEYLYWYRRGVQPVLDRTKQVRPEINNRVVENHAAEIVAFKNGYFLTKPAFYVARRDEKDVNNRIKTLNEMLYLSGKQNVDNQITDWFHTVGIGTLYVEPYQDSECPVRVYALDPRSSFVAYSRRPGNEPVLGVNMVISGRTDSTTEITFDVYTRDRYFKLRGGTTGMVVTGDPVIGTAYEVMDEDINRLGDVPIVEYQYENSRMSSFEAVMPLLNAINMTESNRMDGIEQFIQSLMIFYNCQLGEDENGHPITPRYIREAGAIILKSIGQDKADLKILSEQLDQTQTQVLIDYMYQQVLAICGMPSTTNILNKPNSGQLPAYAFADGGFPETGRLFISDEAGPELVGTIGRQTAVANTQQIVQGIASGVSQANTTQNELLREQNELLRAILAKDGATYLDGKRILKSVETAARNTGVMIMAGGVV